MATAFVLAGGGSLGATEVGMLAALTDAAVQPDFVVGTSVGAVNAVWFALYPSDVDSLARLWISVRRADVFPIRPVRGLLGLLGFRDHLVPNSRLAAPATLDSHQDRVESVSFSPDGTRLAALTRNHTITIWDVARRAQLSSLTYSGLGASTDIAYQPDGRGIVAASLGRFRWSLPGLAQGTFSGGPYIASAVEFTPDSRLLISTDPAGGAMLWNVAADKLERRVSTGQGDVRDVAFSPSGDALASGGEDHAVVVWNLGTRTGATLTGHTGPVQAVAFTRDDELVSGANDSRIIRWSLSTTDAEQRICAETYPRSEVCGTTRPDS